MRAAGAVHASAGTTRIGIDSDWVTSAARPPLSAVAVSVSGPPTGASGVTSSVSATGSLELTASGVARVQRAVAVSQVQPVVGVVPAMPTSARPFGIAAVSVRRWSRTMVGLGLCTSIVTVPGGPLWVNVAGRCVAVSVSVEGIAGVMVVELRSKSENASMVSCGVIGPGAHSAGKTFPLLLASLMWYSLNCTRPHWSAGGAPTGVLKLICTGIDGLSMRIHDWVLPSTPSRSVRRYWRGIWPRVVEAPTVCSHSASRSPFGKLVLTRPGWSAGGA